MNHTVLMADIIASRKKPGKQLIREFKELTLLANKKLKSSLRSPLTITLGDEFQAVAQSVKDAVKVILFLEEHIIHLNLQFKLRYVLHVGTIETAINKKTAHGMLGSGLTNARENLLSLKKEKERFLIKTKNRRSEYQLNRAFFLYQDIIDEWNHKDYVLLSEFLNTKDYKEIAELLGMNTSTAWRRRRSLKIPQYIALKELILSLP